MPETAAIGEVFEVKVMIQHDMESGYRRGQYGERIPRNIIQHFRCRYLGEQVFASEFFPGVAANPYLSFLVRAQRSGEFVFEWEDQHGKVWRRTVGLAVQ